LFEHRRAIIGTRIGVGAGGTLAVVEREELYQGHRIVVMTTESETGAWSYQAEVLDAGGRVASSCSSVSTYASDQDALRAGFSAAAEVVDRGRTSRGKP